MGSHFSGYVIDRSATELAALLDPVIRVGVHAEPDADIRLRTDAANTVLGAMGNGAPTPDRDCTLGDAMTSEIDEPAAIGFHGHQTIVVTHDVPPFRSVEPEILALGEVLVFHFSSYGSCGWSLHRGGEVLRSYAQANPEPATEQGEPLPGEPSVEAILSHYTGLSFAQLCALPALSY